MDITKPNKINPELLEAMNPDKQEVSAVASNVRLSAELAEVKEKYYELIMAVQSKFPDETRHETALRYIMNAEIGSNEAAEATSR